MSLNEHERDNLEEATTTMSLDRRLYEFCRNQLEWLEMELRHSDQKDDADTNDSNIRKRMLSKLKVEDISLGLYGRTILILSKEGGKSCTTVRKNESKKIDLSSSMLLPSHSLKVGDDVQVESCSNGNNSSRSIGRKMDGVVSALDDYKISIVLYESDKEISSSIRMEDENNYRIIPKSMIQVHRKIVSHIRKLQSSWDTLSAYPIIQAAFSPSTKNTKTNATVLPKETKCPSHLNHVQWNAISSCLDNNNTSSNVISLIHGPPGTGKTTTVAEYIYHALNLSQQQQQQQPMNDEKNIGKERIKILVTAPSNVAVDNILLKLISTMQYHDQDQKSNNGSCSQKRLNKIQMVRIGHPARIDPKIIPYSLESHIHRNDSTDIVKDVKNELQDLLRWKTPKEYAKTKLKGDNRTKEIKTLRKEIRVREQKVVKETLERADIVLTTNVGAASKLLDSLPCFDIVVMDEAAQATEASSWIPLLRGSSKVVLAGDHLQLPPTVLSNNPQVRNGLTQTLFERLITNDTNSYVQSHLLSIQYRMHPSICQWASQAMYDNQLTSHSTMSQQTLRHLLQTTMKKSSNNTNINDTTNDKYSCDNTMLDTTLLLIDTSNCDMYEVDNSNHSNVNSNVKMSSRSNPGEARLVEQHVSYLIEQCGMKPMDVAVISPYNGQVELLKSMLLHKYAQLEIKSVDGFQGGEREAVVMSLVRSSPKGSGVGIGFLSEQRRLNVAITRAKRHCAVICDAGTVSQNAFLKELVNYIEDNGDYQSAMEYSGNENYHGSNYNYSTSPTSLNTLNNSSKDTHHQDWIQDIMTPKLEKPNVKSKQKNGQNKLQPKVGKKPSCNNKDIEQSYSKKCHEKEKKVEETDVKERAQTRKEIEEKLSFFSDFCPEGEVLEFSTALSSYDRMIVHEIAEKLGLEHKSEGTEGIDRKIIVKQIKKMNVNEDIDHDGITIDEEVSIINGFSTLDLNESSQSCSEIDESPNVDVNRLDPPPTYQNDLLYELAKEREARKQTMQDSTYKKTKKKKKKGQKLGGKNIGKKVEDDQNDNHLDDLDDMAFLDAQIDRVQNSHGRTITGSGKTYRTIVNGMLISKPKAPETKKNQRLVSSLNSKIKESKAGRKSKASKKKKKK